MKALYFGDMIAFKQVNIRQDEVLCDNKIVDRRCVYEYLNFISSKVELVGI